jgi:nucleosome binding factor SPN SPT16 subunit
MKVEKHVLSLLKDGVLGRDVFSGAVAFIQQERPDLVSRFVKNLGFVVRFVFLLCNRVYTF